VIRVKQESGGRFDLFDPASKPDGGQRELCSILFAEQMSDWAVVWEVLYLVVRPQLDGKHDSPSAFGEAMAGDCLVTAQKELLAEWKDFFLALQRPDLAVMLEKHLAYQAKAIELVQEKLKSPALAEIDNRVEAAMRRTMNEKLGDLEASLDSILGPTPSGNSPT
ncbi:MAG: hypothetical protein L0211_26855, partial [Planctomycetaceae bacterium]|nr:hypothetical protein [Planctomycetaceae bacterium]